MVPVVYMVSISCGMVILYISYKIFVLNSINNLFVVNVKAFDFKVY